MEKQQNMPSGYEKDRKLLVNIKVFIKYFFIV